MLYLFTVRASVIHFNSWRDVLFSHTHFPSFVLFPTSLTGEMPSYWEETRFKFVWSLLSSEYLCGKFY